MSSNKKQDCARSRSRLVEKAFGGLGRRIGERGAAPRGVVRLLHHTGKDELGRLRGFTDGELAPVVAADENEQKRKDNDIPQCGFLICGLVDLQCRRGGGRLREAAVHG